MATHHKELVRFGDALCHEGSQPLVRAWRGCRSPALELHKVQLDVVLCSLLKAALLWVILSVLHFMICFLY